MKHLVTAVMTIVLICPSMAFAGASRGAVCREMADQVVIEYQGMQKLNAWGKEMYFGEFALSNKADRDLKIPLVNGNNPLMVHGAFIELQSRPLSPKSAWEADSVLLDEFYQPSAWLLLSRGGRGTVFLPMSAPGIDSERRSSRQYRTLVRDVDKCEHFSEPFRIGTHR